MFKINYKEEEKRKDKKKYKKIVPQKYVISWKNSKWKQYCKQVEHKTDNLIIVFFKLIFVLLKIKKENSRTQTRLI